MGSSGTPPTGSASNDFATHVLQTLPASDDFEEIHRFPWCPPFSLVTIDALNQQSSRLQDLCARRWLVGRCARAGACVWVLACGCSRVGACVWGVCLLSCPHSCVVLSRRLRWAPRSSHVGVKTQKLPHLLRPSPPRLARLLLPLARHYHLSSLLGFFSLFRDLVIPRCHA